MSDPVDQAEIAYDSPSVDRWEIATAIANLASDEVLPSYADQGRMIAAHKARTVTDMSAWVVARSRPVNPSKEGV
jgi:hypothetical protein